jgi:cellobiose phosphorylase
MADLASFLGLEAEAARYAADHQVMCRRVNDSAWDGEWYVGYFGADGAPKGSHRNTHGQIYLHVQPWTVLAGVAGPERGRQAMEAVYRRLNTPHGIKLTAPGFDGYDPQVGGITSYPPGAKENGGIFLHANPWAMIAECHLGNGRRAYQYYRQINPALQNDRIEIYECEPYVYPQNILGDEHPQFGLARNSWLTGTASWAYQAATQSLLGLQPTHRGLRLDPCLPDTWPGFTASRVFRGARYKIEVVNPNGVSRGITQLELDGRTVTGNVLPLPDGGAVYRVRAVM